MGVCVYVGPYFEVPTKKGYRNKTVHGCKNCSTTSIHKFCVHCGSPISDYYHQIEIKRTFNEIFNELVEEGHDINELIGSDKFYKVFTVAPFNENITLINDVYEYPPCVVVDVNNQRIDKEMVDTTIKFYKLIKLLEEKGYKNVLKYGAVTCHIRF